jgi:hypothetical protein
MKRANEFGTKFNCESRCGDSPDPHQLQPGSSAPGAVRQ